MVDLLEDANDLNWKLIRALQKEESCYSSFFCLDLIGGSFERKSKSASLFSDEARPTLKLFQVGAKLLWPGSGAC